MAFAEIICFPLSPDAAPDSLYGDEEWYLVVAVGSVSQVAALMLSGPIPDAIVFAPTALMRLFAAQQFLAELDAR